MADLFDDSFRAAQRIGSMDSCYTVNSLFIIALKQEYTAFCLHNQ